LCWQLLKALLGDFSLFTEALIFPYFLKGVGGIFSIYENFDLTLTLSLWPLAFAAFKHEADSSVERLV
jgi:hypothetical protein